MARKPKFHWQFIAITTLIVCGCQQYVVQRGANRIASTIPDLYYEQVLDNLSHTIECPETMPYFGVPAQATHINARQFTGTYMPGWDLLGMATWFFDKQTASFAGTVQNQQSIQVQPVTNPDKLALMQLAYWRASGYSRIRELAQDDFNILRSYYKLTDKYVDYNPFMKSGWYCLTKCKKEAVKQGCYWTFCGKDYLYVPCDKIHDFTRFTLGILDIATLDTDYFYGKKSMFQADDASEESPATVGPSEGQTDPSAGGTLPPAEDPKMQKGARTIPRPRNKIVPFPPAPVAPTL